VQMKEIAKTWLKAVSVDGVSSNAAYHKIVTNLTRVQQLLRQRGHFPPLMTPPYHPECQPIEDLWRDVKQYVAREYGRNRTMGEMRLQVEKGFQLYGTPESCSKYWKESDDWCTKFVTLGVYSAVVDLSGPEFDDDDTDNEYSANDDELYDSDSDDDEDF
jgi:hypothetical protein